jgi:ribosome-binding protein aMBF1 (putative translation factor)
MDECFRCGVSGDKVKLSRVVSNQGIVKVCDDCSRIEKLPVVKRATDEQVAQSQRHVSVRDRLAGINNRNRIMGREVTLRDLVDRDLKSKKIQPHPDLIDNFHWTIQRIKRAKKITREQFAKAIGESEATVRMIEQGFLPENNYKIINKIESYLGVNLRKPGTSGFPNTSLNPMEKYKLDNSMTESDKKQIAFDEDSVKKLKIGDLKEMSKKPEDKKQKGLLPFFSRKKEEKENVKKAVDSWEEEYSQDDEKFLDEEENFEEEE